MNWVVVPSKHNNQPSQASKMNQGIDDSNSNNIGALFEPRVGHSPPPSPISDHDGADKPYHCLWWSKMFDYTTINKFQQQKMQQYDNTNKCNNDDWPGDHGEVI